MTWTSTVPTVLLTLIGGLANAIPDVAVIDGYNLTGAPVDTALLISAAPDDEPGVVDQQFENINMRGGRSKETYTIRCEARALNPTAGLNTARTTVYALLAAVGAYLAADPTLGRTVTSAQLGTAQLATSQDKGGAFAALAFGIDIDAYI